jgi:transcriptional regulator with XRE-family HTH domain
MEFDRLEALRVGQELKKIRRQRGLSLAEVETLSGGRWKAVVIGSYERADRAISIGRLSALMAMYQAPISALFPAAALAPISEQAQTSHGIDLTRRAELQHHLPALARFVSAVVNIRGDWNGHILTIRESDLRLLAMSEGVSFLELIEKLEVHRLLVQWR